MVVVVVVLIPNLVFCFGPKLWFWPRPKLNKKRLELHRNILSEIVQC